ncbi:DUF4097 family beta strand repeat-containing protein [Rhodocytophaga aerolata]|uniref:DUF4097 family beta strand repeat-containing protein n=1 Tax=Rhodocytophaga aerolata TaxID=455078 RepID=A0ABT8R723_9BACT|nr:DUF4097 family beta strand repeat-containing protein [Rhodocytophaga aerolata]MDO1447129.1 DUF4097 family beta strand repeat-containing protein [Rhodocytophaga aerolata]
MKNIHIILVCLLLSLYVNMPAFAQGDAKEQITVPLSSPGKPGKLKVGLTNGSIKVTGYDGKEVMVEASAVTRKSDDENTGTTANGMKRISNNAFSLEVEENNNEVDIDTDSWRRKIDLVVRVPKNFSLELEAINQGNIQVEGVNGAMEISNVNGKITLTNVSGSVVANTVNGDITVTFREVTPNTPMAFTTLNGNVDISFPGNAKFNTKIKSDRGDIFTDFDMAVDNSKPKVEQKSSSGTYRVSIDEWVYGKINGGGPEMLFKNMHGNIYIRKTN